MTPAVLHLPAAGAGAAARIADALGAAAEPLNDAPAARVRALFADGRPIVGVMAAGALIRMLAPALRDKGAEPPVVCVGVDGGAVVPLLGGHRGANPLARRIAAILDVAPAVTTASEAALGLALDAPPAGWRLANPADAKTATAALLGGRALCVADAPYAPRPGDQPAIAAVGALAPKAGGPETLIYHPRRVALGFGCTRLAPADALIALAEDVLRGAEIAPGAVAGVYSIDLKADEPAGRALAERLDAPARFFDADRLRRQAPRLSAPSSIVAQAVGAPGVAEAAALAAAGPRAALIAGKTARAGCTVALALAPEPFDGAGVGAPQGRLFIVGLGPGAPRERTAAAVAALDTADLLIGYDGYLSLLAPWEAAGKEMRGAKLGAEEDRARAALDAAAAGRTAALLSSGDAGVYAMAAVVFELLDRAEDGALKRVAVEVVPGVSAMQAAAARFGAPLGHDFCAISLSDLLTPVETIRQRLAAAAAGGFVVALYNPVSARRRTVLGEAQRIFLDARAADTPVLLARALGRSDERCWTTTLGALCVDDVDMVTVVLIGAETTRTFVGAGGALRAYTPRGYRIGAS